MAMMSADQRELFLPLIEGIQEEPPFGLFMRNLVARTGARRAFMLIHQANAAPDQKPAVIHVMSPRATQEPRLDFMRLYDLRLHPFGTLRPERVYALDEMLDYDDPAQLAVQRAALEDMGIRHARWLRVTAGGVADAWLVLVRLREDFSAAAVATLTAIAPHLASALRTLVALNAQRLQAALAQDALIRLGVGQIALDSGGRVMAADPQAEAALAFAPEPGHAAGRRLALLPEAARLLEAACADLAAGTGAPVRMVRIDARRGTDLLLRRADLALPEPAARPQVIGVLRQAEENGGATEREGRADSPGALVLQAQHGLSAREAALAMAIARGEPLVESGLDLGLTVETTRNYSKRIYAKTGAVGQADLARIVLSGLAPLA